MLVIVIAWSGNIGKIFSSNDSQSKEESKLWDDLKSDLISNFDEAAKKSEIAAKETSDKLVEAKGEILASELIKATEELVVDEPVVATSTEATSSAPIFSCPAYIDCMPKIGDAPACQIPVGCEDVTQIAY